MTRTLLIDLDKVDAEITKYRKMSYEVGDREMEFIYDAVGDTLSRLSDFTHTQGYSSKPRPGHISQQQLDEIERTSNDED